MTIHSERGSRHLIVRHPHLTRIVSLQALAPALIHPAFGHFLDWAAHVKLDVDSTEAALKLIDTMSRSYDNTASTATSVSGKARGSEEERARIFRSVLLKYMHARMRNAVGTIEPCSLRSEHVRIECVMPRILR